VDYLAHRRPLLAILFEQAVHQRDQPLGQPGHPLGERRRLLVHVLAEDLAHPFADKRRLAAEHGVKEHAQRVAVGPIVHPARAAALLGRHVDRSAHDGVGAGAQLRGILGGIELGDAEVEQLGALAAGQLRVGDDHDIFWLEGGASPGAEYHSALR
jgi:hypothetical protein